METQKQDTPQIANDFGTLLVKNCRIGKGYVHFPTDSFDLSYFVRTVLTETVDGDVKAEVTFYLEPDDQLRADMEIPAYTIPLVEVWEQFKDRFTEKRTIVFDLRVAAEYRVDDSEETRTDVGEDTLYRLYDIASELYQMACGGDTTSPEFTDALPGVLERFPLELR